jgi:hypothetical protein
MDRAEKFIDQLYKEKEIHKEHRQKLLINKLIFVTSLIGFGSLGVKFDNLRNFLFLIPFVCICFDIYIFSEDFKVKRIGYFIISIKIGYYEKLSFFQNQLFNTEIQQAICYLEAYWEKWLERFREPWASKASFIISLVATFGSAFILAIEIHFNKTFYLDYRDMILILFPLWLLSSIVIIAIVFIYYKTKMNNLFKLPPDLYKPVNDE